MKQNTKRPPAGENARLAERIVREVKEDFTRRQAERRRIERGWELNMNFLAGNQYCGIGPAGDAEEETPRYAWQYRRVFNHIAPAVDTLRKTCVHAPDAHGARGERQGKRPAHREDLGERPQSGV